MSQENISQENISQENVSQEPVEQETPSLDALLSEYEPTTAEPQPEPKPEPSADVIARLERIEKQQADKWASEALNRAVANLKSKVGEDLSDLMAEGALQALAMRNPKLVQAFQNMDADPAGFEKVMTGVAEAVKAELKRPDPKQSADSEAARAAVRGQDTQNTPKDDAPSRAEMSSWSDAKFEEYKRSQAG
jgi:hypothetical protein